MVKILPIIFSTDITRERSKNVVLSLASKQPVAFDF